jgi:two-component system KDP operon response regulator KdpE
LIANGVVLKESTGSYMKRNTILVVDDDPSIRKFVKANLEARDYDTLVAGDGNEAIAMIEEKMPDLVLLDIMMPNLNGFEVCRRVREWSQVPIIMVSAKDGEDDKVKCFDIGADDYLTKPFALRELLSRIMAVLKRAQTGDHTFQQPIYHHGSLTVDFSRQIASLDGNTIELTSLEYKILAFLTLNAGRIITPNQLLEKIWGEEYSGDYRLLQVNICRLRRKIKDSAKNSQYIQTKPGIGYIATLPN